MNSYDQIGLIMKERGDILEACRLYQRSVMMAPDHASLSLNLMHLGLHLATKFEEYHMLKHTYTLRRDDLRALAWGKRFLAQKPQLFGSFLAALDGKPVNDDAKIFDIKDFDAANEFHDALAIGLSIFKLLFLAQPRLFESKNDPSWLKRLRTMEIESHIVGPGVLFSFWDKLSIIPIESPVIFLLGEIDCRDGILRSVQKGKHDSFDDALRTVVNVYLEPILTLRCRFCHLVHTEDLLVQIRKKLPSNRLFVHPVPIALPETRFLTMAMNTLLETDWSQLSMEKARVKLLRIESIFVKDVPEHPENADALTLAKLELLPELRLDGIHMSTEAMEALKIWKLHEREPPLRYTQISTPMGRSSLRKMQTEQLQRQTVRELIHERQGEDSTTAYFGSSRPGTAGSCRSVWTRGSSQSTRVPSSGTPSLDSLSRIGSDSTCCIIFDIFLQPTGW
eukprot:s1553_g14.t1